MAAIHRLAHKARLMRGGLAGEVPSPCVSICRMDPATQWCEGCYRTLDEIAGWGRMDEGSRRQVWERIDERIGQPASGRALAPMDSEKDE